MTLKTDLKALYLLNLSKNCKYKFLSCVVKVGIENTYLTSVFTLLFEVDMR